MASDSRDRQCDAGDKPGDEAVAATLDVINPQHAPAGGRRTYIPEGCDPNFLMVH